MMMNHISKATMGAIALMGVLAFSSCSEDKEDLAFGGSDCNAMSLSLKGFPTTTATEAPAATQPMLKVFQFSNSKLSAKTVLKEYNPESIDLMRGTTTSLYCVSGVDIDAPEGTAESEFVKTTFTTAEGVNSAPFFLSGSATIEATQKNCEVNMLRGVARIDLDAREADMEISGITVDNAPATTYVFATGEVAPSTATTVYTHTYESAPTGVEKGVFMVFESAGEMNVTVHGTANGTPISVPAVISTVERNKVYTLRVYAKNATVKADFNISNWEDGGTVPGQTDLSQGLHIDRENSVFPEGVKVDYVNNIIEVPGTGAGGMKVAFSTEVRVDIDTVCFKGANVEIDSVEAKYVHIAAQKAFNTPTGVVSSFDIDIDAQLKGRPGYEIKMYVKKTFMTSSYDCVTIRVAQSPYQIRTVNIAGSNWMAFNATGNDLNDQIYPEEGLSVEEMYQNNWVQTVGNFFQYGRLKAYSPWEKNDPNGNSDTPRNIPWTDPAAMPLPAGYHVASAKEWQMLLPVGTTIPSTYIAGNGEEIKADLITLPGTLSGTPSTAANNAKLMMRYVRFESMETHNVLIFPICGQKTPSWDEYPGSGTAMHNRVIMWIADDRQVWLFELSTKNGVLTATQGINRWNYDGFLPVRGIKDNN